MSLLSSGLVYLTATVIAVPLFKRLKLGAILGYLVAGVIIGPAALGLVADAEQVLHVAEFGVILLLFIIGLELEPQKLWKMRQAVMLTGGGQLLLSALLLFAILMFVFALGWPQSLVIGLALALSSTAFAIQLMAEQGILKTPPGQQGFAILLMQDLAVIPILLLVEGLAGSADASAPAWYISLSAIAFVLLAGRYLLNPLLRILARYGSEEVMTAAALLIVIATALAMEQAGLSMGMGAFLAGMLLANSSFRHQLETEIEPFKGLLLGLFFIAIGMNLDLGLLVSEPLFILTAALGLIALKTLLMTGLLMAAKQKSGDAMRVALMLSQGGEFAFVVMTQAAGNGLIAPDLADKVSLIVGISMALTSPVVILYSLLVNSRQCPPVYDTAGSDDEPQVLIAGFGRFGQISARILTANHISFTALDKDAKQIAFVEQFGNKVFFGDACRLDLLKAAGIEHAKILLIAVDGEDEVLKIAQLVREEFPHIRIIARARNRITVRSLHKLGVRDIVREMFGGSLEAANLLLRAQGYSSSKAEYMVDVFRHHDEAMLQSSLDESDDMPGLIERSKRGREQLESLFTQDKQDFS
ncbi:monovalent cation:proton antiporter-2 (CPA2) family protein [Aliiglaciecola sp. CAU 1673]|uniref:monovalent cation:proton antiporter-2 (CPA2) family protein n=1 Tax=Aliiglaciecola sp. CAU 1673 TaxID=3032595 RepID=UPI0023DBBAE3|nr:monovalent cation:proton antiporter-2 (CPA2) family protein [Aliiglaciecola sp. CAU 1673]MDF2178402.1 monovalent cation:proton antiporter-2 (CPA2) family protein [Aliiglaciecola sp. CAU 1673]